MPQQLRKFSTFVAGTTGETYEVLNVDWLNGHYLIENIRTKERSTHTFNEVNSWNFMELER